MTDKNLRHWSALYQTDPAHTKPFTRSGGFRGTAIKPIYATQKMTEHFGPCGIGWGMEKPEFQLVNGDNRELLVYCTVALWYLDGNARGTVYGVGGDKVIGYVKAGQNRPERWDNDDEALKKAYTDALSNAMKQIGVGGDVHMGQFDDSKYRDEVARELEQKRQEQNGGADNDTNSDPHFLNDPRAKSDDYRIVSGHIKAVIDSYEDIEELNKRAMGLGFRPGSPHQPRPDSLAGKVHAAKAETYEFLMDRLDKRRGTLAQATGMRKAA